MNPQTKKDFFDEDDGKGDVVNNILDENDPWSIVGVDMAADEVAKRKAYVKKSLLVHPDRNRSKRALEAFQKLQNAYENIKGENMKTLEDGEIAAAEIDGIIGMVGSDNHIQLIPINGDKEAKTVTQAEWEAIKMEMALKRLKERKGEFESPPSEVQQLYAEAAPFVLQLLRDPSNKEAEAGIESSNAKIANKSANYRIDPGLIKISAKQAIGFKNNIDNDPSARKNYNAISLVLQRHGEMLGWPKEWRLESLPEDGGAHEEFFRKAQIYVGVLKQNPEDREAKEKLEELNHQQMRRIQDGENMDTDGTSSTVDYEELAKYYRQWNESITSFKRSPITTAYLDAAQKVNDSLKGFLSSHGYPQAWSMELPSDLELGGGARKLLEAPRTRLGDPILAYREWKAFGTKTAYLFAVLNQGNSPIGSLISGTELGNDSKTNYLAYEGKRKVQKYQKQEYQFPTLHYVFERSGTRRQETWVIFSTAANPRTQIAMTMSDYALLRKGRDAVYDVQVLCRQKDVPLPSSIQKKLNKANIADIGGPRSGQPPASRQLESKDNWNQRNITADDLLRPNRQKEFLKDLLRRTPEGSSQDPEEVLLRRLLHELQLENRVARTGG